SSERLHPADGYAAGYSRPPLYRTENYPSPMSSQTYLYDQTPDSARSPPQMDPTPPPSAYYSSLDGTSRAPPPPQLPPLYPRRTARYQPYDPAGPPPRRAPAAHDNPAAAYGFDPYYSRQQFPDGAAWPPPLSAAPSAAATAWPDYAVAMPPRQPPSSYGGASYALLPGSRRSPAARAGSIGSGGMSPAAGLASTDHRRHLHPPPPRSQHRRHLPPQPQTMMMMPPPDAADDNPLPPPPPMHFGGGYEYPTAAAAGQRLQHRLPQSQPLSPAAAAARQHYTYLPPQPLQLPPSESEFDLTGAEDAVSPRQTDYSDAPTPPHGYQPRRGSLGPEAGGYAADTPTPPALAAPSALQPRPAVTRRAARPARLIATPRRLNHSPMRPRRRDSLQTATSPESTGFWPDDSLSPADRRTTPDSLSPPSRAGVVARRRPSDSVLELTDNEPAKRRSLFESMAEVSSKSDEVLQVLKQFLQSGGGAGISSSSGDDFDDLVGRNARVLEVLVRRLAKEIGGLRGVWGDWM
ncbi:hypothetical protein HK405_011802, partial [Cladochytrium tenue]